MKSNATIAAIFAAAAMASMDNKYDSTVKRRAPQPTVLTNKQAKARAKSKRAKKARRK